MFRHLAPLAAVTLALVAPAAALAKLPAPKVRTVVFGKSVAGVKLGSSLAAAKKAWGSGSSCGAAALPPTTPGTQCTWSTTPGAKPDRGAKLTLVAIKGKVVAITIANGTGGAKAGIRKYLTSKGIGVGDTFAAARKAYPKLSALSGTPAAANADLGSGKTATSLFFVSGKLDSITVGSPY